MRSIITPKLQTFQSIHYDFQTDISLRDYKSIQTSSVQFHLLHKNVYIHVVKTNPSQFMTYISFVPTCPRRYYFYLALHNIYAPFYMQSIKSIVQDSIQRLSDLTIDNKWSSSKAIAASYYSIAIVFDSQS